MVRVLYISYHDHRYSGDTATKLVGRYFTLSFNFIEARNVDHHIQLVTKKLLGRKTLPSLRELGRTTEERCENYLKLLTRLKRAVLVEGGSKDDKKLYSLLRRKMTFVVSKRTYTPPRKPYLDNYKR